MTIAALVRARAGDERVGLRFEDASWTWAEVVVEARRRAAFFRAHAPSDAPLHVGVLLDNIPEFWFTLCGAALAGATVVGINPTRRGPELARDIAHTHCAFVLTERSHLALFDTAGDLGIPGPLYVVDDPAWLGALAPFADAPLPDVDPAPTDTFMLIFTSGTTGAPKAVRMGHARLAAYGGKLAEMFALTPDDVCYSVMPLFHSNAAVAGFTNVLAVGRDGRVAPPLLRHELPARPPPLRRHVLQLRRQAAELHPRDTCRGRRCRQPVAGCVRERGLTPRHRSVRDALRLRRRRRVRLDRGRIEHVAHPRHPEGLARDAGRSGPARRSSIPTPRRNARPRASTRRAGSSTPTRRSARS